MKITRRVRGGVVAAAAVIGGVALTACNPEPGEARFTLSGAVSARVDGPTVTCRPPGDGGETVTPSYDWSGTIDGMPSAIGVAGLGPSGEIDSAYAAIGDDQWAAIFSPSEVQQVSFDEGDGTVRVTGTLPHRIGTLDEPLTFTIVTRCPIWPVP